MPLEIGERLGPYQILGVLGAGGMGEVYRARDTTLQRDVAIKVLPAAMAANPKRLVRFEREARALAALNHPGIAAVYGIEEPAPGSARGRALVMELVDGEDLSVLIARRAWSADPAPPTGEASGRQAPGMPFAEALPIARQVADALAAAHDAGIVHRDLKPANIKVREDGRIKILDFGLATVASADADSDADSGSGTNSDPARDSGPEGLPNTLTLGGLTRDGDVVGTAAYMAPEQARGTRVDKRADIWAFGVVLFEMIAGRRPFADGDTKETLARVLAADPDWHTLPADTPPSIRRLLARCLAKDRSRRLHDISDARLEIDEAAVPPVPGVPLASPAGAAGGSRWAPALTLAAAGLLAGLAVGMVLWRLPREPQPVTQARVGVSPAAELSAGGMHPTVVLPAGGARTALAWSPDGRTLAFIGVQDGVRQIFLRDLAGDSARALAGTEGVRAFALSPDGSEAAFWADGAIRKVKLAGGPPVKLCDAGTVNGIAFGTSRIVFVEAPLLFEISPAGGERRQLTQWQELVRHSVPALLPGDKALLYTEHERQWTSGDERVMLLPLEPGAAPRVLIRQAADARYLPTGHLAFLRQGTLFVVPFDARTLEVRGDPVAVLKDVSQSVVAWDSDDLTLAGQFAVSPQGALAYVRSPLPTYPDRELVSVDRAGRITPITAPAKGYRNHVELSPDGSRLAVSVQSGSDVQAFAWDLRRGSMSRLAEVLRGEVIVSAWSRDDRIAVQVVEAGKITAAIVGPDAASEARPVADSNGFWASSWSPEGRLVGMKDGHLWLYTPDDAGARPSALVPTTAAETQPMWSPDGRWVAYTSDTTGRLEVHMRPFPGPGEAITVSTGGGSSPAWNPNGRELFYVEPGPARDRMMSVDVAAAGRPGSPRELFSIPDGGLSFGPGVLTPYAVAPDGQRFYAVRQPRMTVTPVIDVNIVLGWFEDVLARTPGLR